MLSINLDSVLIALEGEEESEPVVGLQMRLKEELLSSIQHKHWVYHPSQAGAKSTTSQSMRSTSAGKYRGKRFAKRELSQAEIDAAVAGIKLDKSNS